MEMPELEFPQSLQLALKSEVQLSLTRHLLK